MLMYSLWREILDGFVCVEFSIRCVLCDFCANLLGDDIYNYVLASENLARECWHLIFCLKYGAN